MELDFYFFACQIPYLMTSELCQERWRTLWMEAFSSAKIQEMPNLKVLHIFNICKCLLLIELWMIPYISDPITRDQETNSCLEGIRSIPTKLRNLGDACMPSNDQSECHDGKNLCLSNYLYSLTLIHLLFLHFRNWA